MIAHRPTYARLAAGLLLRLLVVALIGFGGGQGWGTARGPVALLAETSGRGADAHLALATGPRAVLTTQNATKKDPGTGAAEPDILLWAGYSLPPQATPALPALPHPVALRAHPPQGAQARAPPVLI